MSTKETELEELTDEERAIRGLPGRIMDETQPGENVSITPEELERQRQEVESNARLTKEQEQAQAEHEQRAQEAQAPHPDEAPMPPQEAIDAAVDAHAVAMISHAGVIHDPDDADDVAASVAVWDALATHRQAEADLEKHIRELHDHHLAAADKKRTAPSTPFAQVRTAVDGTRDKLVAAEEKLNAAMQHHRERQSRHVKDEARKQIHARIDDERKLAAAQRKAARELQER